MITVSEHVDPLTRTRIITVRIPEDALMELPADKEQYLNRLLHQLKELFSGEVHET
jgi:hypothetical protein